MAIRTQLKAGSFHDNHNDTMGDGQPSNWRRALLALQLICPFCHVDATRIERSGHRCHCTACQQDWDGLTVSERRFRRSFRG